MAHPFSAVPTPYRVATPVGRYWANCAWDAFGIPVLLEADGVCSTPCPCGCGSDLRLEVHDGRADCTRGAVVHFAVPPARFWDDIGFT